MSEPRFKKGDLFTHKQEYYDNCLCEIIDIREISWWPSSRHKYTFESKEPSKNSVVGTKWDIWESDIFDSFDKFIGNAEDILGYPEIEINRLSRVIE